MLILVFGLLGATSWIVVMVIAGGAWKTISSIDPNYARKLYISPLDQVIYRTGPVSYKYLFCARPPKAMKARINVLRVAILFQLVIALAFITFIFLKIR